MAVPVGSETEGSPLSKEAAVVACFSFALFYVAVLYAPTFVLRLPPAPSLNAFMIRRFLSAAFASFTSLMICHRLLPARTVQDMSLILSIYGIRVDHMWQAVAFPLCLTSFIYVGSIVSRTLALHLAWEEEEIHTEASLVAVLKVALQKLMDDMYLVMTNILAWRNYVMAPITEELVFRACMIPVLLCAGFKTYNIIFFSPIFFSLAHLNHFLELYYGERYSFSRASLVVGVQLGYTVMFGWYASFLFLRTGHLLAPIVAHILCNKMGLPVISSSSRKVVLTSFAIGCASFFVLLFPATSPHLYNSNVENCSCWHGYCSWSRGLQD